MEDKFAGLAMVIGGTLVLVSLAVFTTLYYQTCRVCRKLGGVR